MAGFAFVERASSDSGLAVSFIVLLHFLPAFLFAPITGPIADRCNRVNVLVASSLVSAAATAATALLPGAGRGAGAPGRVELVLFYAALLVQFTGSSLYVPARSALLPRTVRPKQLATASLLDSFTWSITQAFGATLGGAIADVLGLRACFLLDTAAYVACAGCAHLLPRHLGAPGDAEPQAARVQPQTELAKRGRAAAERGADGRGPARPADADLLPSPLAADAAGGAAHHEGGVHLRHPGADATAPAAVSTGVAASLAADVEAAPLPLDDEGSATAADAGGARRPAAAAAVAGLSGPSRLSGVAAAAGAGAGGPVAAGPGAQPSAPSPAAATTALSPPPPPPPSSSISLRAFFLAPATREVAAFALLKAGVAATYGANDVFAVRLSRSAMLRPLGSPERALGWLFGCMGVGSIITPLLLGNWMVPARDTLASAAAVSLWMTAVGLLGVALSATALLQLVFAAVRAGGMASLWICSTVLLQISTPNAVLGRVAAAEAAAFTVAETLSSTAAGAALDAKLGSLTALLLVNALVGTIIAAAWQAFERFTRTDGAGNTGRAIQTDDHERQGLLATRA